MQDHKLNKNYIYFRNILRKFSFCDAVEWKPAFYVGKCEQAWTYTAPCWAY